LEPVAFVVVAAFGAVAAALGAGAGAAAFFCALANPPQRRMTSAPDRSRNIDGAMIGDVALMDTLIKKSPSEISG
jgi:hypothetical protein